MAWPLGDLISVVYEVYGRENSIRGAAAQLGIGIGTVQDILVNPDRERRLGTLEAIQGFYERVTPNREDGPYGSDKFSSPYWLDSQIEDLAATRGADSFLINWKGEPYANSESGWRSSGWRSLNEWSIAGFRGEKNIGAGQIGDIRFARQTF